MPVSADNRSLFAGRTVLLISPQPWRGLALSKHHYAVALAEIGAKVFFLNPPSGRWQRPAIASGAHPNLNLVDYATLSRGRRFFPSRINDALEFVQAKLIERRIGQPVDVVWSFDSTRFTKLHAFRAQLRLFHAVDRVDHAALRPTGMSADAVLSVSTVILDDFAKIGISGHFVSHGLAKDFECAGRARLAELARVGAEPAALPRKVGYMGNLIHPAIDHAAFSRIVSETPEAEFHLWGPYYHSHLGWKHSSVPAVTAFISFLEKQANVILHGLQPPRVVAGELGKMDILLTCYDPVREMNCGSNSHKVLEYLSTGKPVVSNHVSAYMEPGIRGEMLCMPPTTDNRQLPALFRRSLESVDELHRLDLQERRIRFALSHCYRGQLREIERIVGRRLR